MAEQPLSPEEGFTSILERYEKMVYGFALARTGSRADADDVFQEVFLAYFQCGKHFREEEYRRAWLLRTTLNFSRRDPQQAGTHPVKLLGLVTQGLSTFTAHRID